MSATNYLPQRHLNLVSNSPPYATSKAHPSPRLSDRLAHLLHEIESFLLACTYEEMCSFWKAIANMRQYFQDLQTYSLYVEIPYFLSDRRKNRDFCRILEVLADLNYPKLHLSQNQRHVSKVTSRATSRVPSHAKPDFMRSI